MAPEKPKTTRYLYDAGARGFTVLFALLLAVPGVGSLFADDAARSRWENRPLAQLPVPFDPPAGSSFFSGLDRYLNDHFGFALELNRLHRELLFFVFQDSPSPAVNLGKDGFVFLTSSEDDKFSVLRSLCVRGMNAAAARRSAESWIPILEHFSGTHDHVALLIVPSKPTLYPEKFTTAIPRRYREACAQYDADTSVAGTIARTGRERGHIVMFPYQEFSRQKYQNNFYPRENFHSTGPSAHWLGRETLARLGIAVSVEYEERVHGPITTYDLMNVLGFTRRVETTQYPYTAFSLDKMPRTPIYVRDYFQRVQLFGVVKTGKPLSERSALVIGNSFAPIAAEHLAPGYRSLTYIMLNGLQKGEYVRFFTELVPRIGADDLIFVYNDNVAAVAARMWDPELRRANALR